MKPIDTLLWPLVSKRWMYALVVFLAWSAVLPLVGLSILLPAVPSVILLVVGAAAILGMIWLLVDSRSRFVRWRKWAMWKN